MSNKDKYDLYYISQLEAIIGRLVESDIRFENKVRRWYSRNFHTSLQDTFKLSWPFIVSQYYEDQIENADFNSTFDLAVSNYLPDFIDQNERDNEEFAKALVEEQETTLNKKNKKTKKTENIKDVEVPKIKEYSMNFEDDDDL